MSTLLRLTMGALHSTFIYLEKTSFSILASFNFVQICHKLVSVPLKESVTSSLYIKDAREKLTGKKLDKTANIPDFVEAFFFSFYCTVNLVQLVSKTSKWYMQKLSRTYFFPLSSTILVEGFQILVNLSCSIIALNNKQKFSHLLLFMILCVLQSTNI